MKTQFLFYLAACLVTLDVFGGDAMVPWEKTVLRTVPVYFRTDGFSQYTDITFEATRQNFEDKFITPLAAGGIAGIEWGCNAGTTSTFDSGIEPIVGSGLTPADWKQMRTLDYTAHSNLKKLIDSGNDPLALAVEAAHKQGMKLFARMEMNRGYGDVRKESWRRTLFNGKFSVEHPEYRIPGRLHMDFKYKAVRDYKLSLLREMIQKGCDGIMADFVTDQIYFTDPENGRPLMTQFIREIRKMLDEEGRRRNRKFELFIRVGHLNSYESGLDWKRCMAEGLIDYISVFKDWPASDYFDYRIDELIAYRNEAGSTCKVYGHIWQSLGLVDTDLQPNSPKRYSKPKTVGMFVAQAALHNLSGCDGLELGFASPQQWRSFYGLLGTPKEIEFADKHYMVDIKPYLPMVFTGGKGVESKTVRLRVADNFAKARKAGLKVNAKIILTSNLGHEGKLILSINGKGEVTAKGKSSTGFISSSDINAKASHSKSEKNSFLHERTWYQRGRSEVIFPAEWLKQKDNVIEFRYSGDELEIRWIELLVEYSPKQGISARMQEDARKAATLKRLEKLYIGKKAENRADLSSYTGKDAVNAIVGKWRKAAYIANYEQLSINYRDRVDFQLRRNQIILCPQTAEVLYSSEMVPEPLYPKGLYPELEKLVSVLTGKSADTRERVLAIMRYCRDLKNKPTTKWGSGFMFGGTEKQLIEKGEDLCEALGRLFVALCEIADIPARIVMHDIGGHITAEAYIDGYWGYIDPKTGIYFLNSDGVIASAWELMLYPEMMLEQPAKVKSDLHPKYKWDSLVDKYFRKYFNSREVNGFEYYSLKDTGKYDYRQISWENIHELGFAEANRKYVEAIRNVFSSKE